MERASFSRGGSRTRILAAQNIGSSCCPHCVFFASSLSPSKKKGAQQKKETFWTFSLRATATRRLRVRTLALSMSNWPLAAAVISPYSFLGLPKRSYQWGRAKTKKKRAPLKVALQKQFVLIHLTVSTDLKLKVGA